MDRPDFLALIPDIALWNDGRGTDPETWVGGVGTVELAIGYSLIFWPRFVRLRGYVLRSHPGTSQHDWERAIDIWEKEPNWEKASCEALLNHVHLLDIHSAPATEPQLRYLGRALKDIHQVKLKHDFPDLNFEVSFNDEPGLDLIDYELTFWQVAV